MDQRETTQQAMMDQETIVSSSEEEMVAKRSTVDKNEQSKVINSSQGSIDGKSVYSSDDDIQPRKQKEGVPVHEANKSDPRKRRKRHDGVKYQRETSLQTIKNIPKDCCSSNCIQSIAVTTIQSCRLHFYGLKQMQQCQFIQDSLLARNACQNIKQRPTFLLEDKEVCETCWKMVYGIKNRRYHFIRKKLHETRGEKLNFQDARLGMTYPTEAYLMAVIFVRRFVKQLGIAQPETDEINLPTCLTKSILFLDYSLHCLIYQDKSLKIGRFFEMLKIEFPTWKFQKPHTCTDCTVFKKIISKDLTTEEAKGLELIRKDHLTLKGR